LIFPGAGYVEYLLEMCYKEDENPALRNINFNKTLKWHVKENEGSGIVSGTVSLEFVKEGTELHVTCNDSVHCIAEIRKQDKEFAIIAKEGHTLAQMLKSISRIQEEFKECTK